MGFYCALANYGITIDNDDTLMPCCQYNLNKSQLPKLSHRQAADFEKTVRPQIIKDLEQGVLHAGCDVCWHQEKISGKSLRTDSNKFYTDDPRGIVDMEVRLGNVCNLKCPMCGPYASSLWYAEMSKHRDQFMENNYYRLIDKKDPVDSQYKPDRDYYTSKWYDEQTVFEFVDLRLHNLRKLNISGGEPFMSDTMRSILQTLSARQDLHPDFTIQINTNGTVLDQTHIELLQKIKYRVRICISLEGVGKHNDYLRHPSNWQDIDKNIKILCGIRDKRIEKNFSVTSQHTVQPASVYSFLPLAEYCYQMRIPMVLSPVYNSKMDLSAINQDEKNKVKNIHCDTCDQDTLERFKRIIRKINPKEQSRKSYKKYIGFLDKIRNTNYESLFGPL